MSLGVLVLLIAAGLLTSLVGLVWAVAYRLGFAEGKLTIPLKMIEDLVVHHVRCSGGDPEKMIGELAAVLGLPEMEGRRLTTRALGICSKDLAAADQAHAGEAEPSLAVVDRTPDGPRGRSMGTQQLKGTIGIVQ